MGDEPITTNTSRLRGRWWLRALVGTILLALFGPPCVRDFRYNQEISQFQDEAHRLGGWAGFPPESPGDEFEVDLRDTPVDDEQFARLVRMPAFRYVIGLSLARTHVTDRGMDLLANHLISLLDVSGTKVTDRGLASIAKMQHLVFLNVSGTDVSDAGLDPLIARAAAIHLQTVNLQDTRVSKAGAERLRKVIFQPTVISGPSQKQ
jgi:hypothetical protein